MANTVPQSTFWAVVLGLHSDTFISPSVSPSLSLRAARLMHVRYTLTLADHLAWYDYYLTTPQGAHLRSRVPFIAGSLNQMRRRRFSRQLTQQPNLHALGERTLELTEVGVREFSSEFSFTTAWSDMGLVAVTFNHLFLAHVSMNSHIVPLSFFASDAQRESFVSFAKSQAPDEALQCHPIR